MSMSMNLAPRGQGTKIRSHPKTFEEKERQLPFRVVEAVKTEPPEDEGEHKNGMVLRSTVGTKGDKIPLVTNYLRLKVAAGRPGVVEYHVSLACEMGLENCNMRRKALKQFEDRLGCFSFDGRVLFLPYILENDVTVLHGVHPVNSDFDVTAIITFVKVMALEDALVFLNVLFQGVMFELGYTKLIKGFVDLESPQKFNQYKLETWTVENVTVEEKVDGLMINVNRINRVLSTETIYEYLQSIRGEPNWRNKFQDFVINRVVLTKYNYKMYKIDSVNWDWTPASMIKYKDKTISFAHYLKTQVNMDVKEMNQPMLIGKWKPMNHEKARGETQQIKALLPEFCYMTGLTDHQREDDALMSELAKVFRQTPEQRVDELNKFIKRLFSNKKALGILHQWNLIVDPSLIRLQGRIIEGPSLILNERVTIPRCTADFGREIRNTLYDPIPVENYVVICSQRDIEEAVQFNELYMEAAKFYGIKMLQMGEIIRIRGIQPHDFHHALQACCNRPKGVQFVVVIIPNRDDVYSAIKKYCVNEYPIPSQCILSKTLDSYKKHRIPAIVRNITLQINCKLGGSIWALKNPLREQIMLVGIDGAHYPNKKESVICLVASMTNECTKYFSRSMTLPVHQELASSLRIMMEDALENYERLHGGCLPDRIVIFRDGGSVGGLKQIIKTELHQLKKAQMGFAPKAAFSYVLVAKRISQRFFLKSQMGKRFLNPPPGSVVDQTVTFPHPQCFDFYLVSRKAGRGTVNPTHYIVFNPVEDKIAPDLIQKLAYVTSFMYYNWAGTIRVPAMVQYAHKMAYLLSRYVKAPPRPEMSNHLYYL